MGVEAKESRDGLASWKSNSILTPAGSKTPFKTGNLTRTCSNVWQGFSHKSNSLKSSSPNDDVSEVLKNGYGNAWINELYVWQCFGCESLTYLFLPFHLEKNDDGWRKTRDIPPRRRKWKRKGPRLGMEKQNEWMRIFLNEQWSTSWAHYCFLQFQLLYWVFTSFMIKVPL